MSELEAWDADNECSHGRLDWQPCSPCGREGRRRTYPGVQNVVAIERRDIKEQNLAAVFHTSTRPLNERTK